MTRSKTDKYHEAHGAQIEIIECATNRDSNGRGIDIGGKKMPSTVCCVDVWTKNGTSGRITGNVIGAKADAEQPGTKHYPSFDGTVHQALAPKLCRYQ